MRRPGLALALAALVPACASAPPPAVAGRVELPAPAPPPPPPPDPLGPMPVPPPAPAYVPPKPEVFAAKTGVTVWLLERHALPYVSMTLTVPTGSASDATFKSGAGGLVMMTADMLDEGAGSRGSIELSRAEDALGATIETTANPDESRVSLTVLKKNLAPAFALFSDIVARPRFDPAEWKREYDSVLNDLTERASDPEEVAKVAVRAALFGASHPYGHPVEGTLASARTWTLGDVRRVYRDVWRPDRAILVVVGDVTQAELRALVDAKEGLAAWRAPKSAPPAPLAPAAPTGPWPKLVLVDRPDAPQSVIAVARPGVAASDPAAPVAVRANVVLGGGFSSRLNTDLRDEHGYTYSASSQLGVDRGVGSFVASAAVTTEKTGEALTAMLADIAGYAQGGLTDAEVDKSRSKSRADLVELFEGVDRAAAHLALDASLGLGPDYEQVAAAKKGAATKADLDAQAKLRFDPAAAVVVVVGPRADVEPQLRALGYQDIQYRDPDGNIVKPAPLARAAPQPLRQGAP